VTGRSLDSSSYVEFSPWIRTTLRIVAGVFTALVAVELGLRLFVTPGSTPRPDVAKDSFDAPSFARRQIEEGVATSHFSLFGARLTGNKPLRSMAPTVILGDSYVAAEQVGDEETMGAWLERLARASNMPLDVRQFGWLGASPAEYLLVADEIRRQWNPGQVFIVLSANDFDNNALVLAQPSLRVSPHGDVRIVGGGIAPLSGKPPRGFALVTLFRHRWLLLSRRYAPRPTTPVVPTTVADVNPAAPPDPLPDSLEYERAPEAIVRALHEAYGPSVTLVYLAEVRLKGDDKAPAIEAGFVAACARVQARCVSTRRAMQAAYRAGRVGHGAGIALLGNGHLNAVGHEVVGRIMWDAMATSRGASRHEGR